MNKLLDQIRGIIAENRSNLEGDEELITVLQDKLLKAKQYASAEDFYADYPELRENSGDEEEDLPDNEYEEAEEEDVNELHPENLNIMGEEFEHEDGDKHLDSDKIYDADEDVENLEGHTLEPIESEEKPIKANVNVPLSRPTDKTAINNKIMQRHTELQAKEGKVTPQTPGIQAPSTDDKMKRLQELRAKKGIVAKNELSKALTPEEEEELKALEAELGPHTEEAPKESSDETEQQQMDAPTKAGDRFHMDQYRLRVLKDIAKKYTANIEKQKLNEAEPHKNPLLYVKGKKEALHQELMGDHAEQLHNFLQDPRLANLSRQQRRQIFRLWKEKYVSENPNFLKDLEAHGDIHSSLAGEAHQNRKDHLFEEAAGIISGGHTGEGSDARSAAEHLGQTMGDEGETQTYSKVGGNISKDAIEALRGKLKSHFEKNPDLAERIKHINNERKIQGAHLEDEDLQELHQQQPEEEVKPQKIKTAIGDVEGKKVKIDPLSQEDGEILGDYCQDFMPIVHGKVKSFAGRYPGVAKDELESAGYDGLIRAVHTYTPGAGASFRGWVNKTVHHVMNNHANKATSPMDLLHTKYLREYEKKRSTPKEAEPTTPKETKKEE